MMIGKERCWRVEGRSLGEHAVGLHKRRSKSLARSALSHNVMPNEDRHHIAHLLDLGYSTNPFAMRNYKRSYLKDRLGGIFSATDADRALSWFIAAAGKKIVVVVGAGFSRNAVRKSDGGPAIVPLWDAVHKVIATDLGVSTASYDPLLLTDLYRNTHHEPRYVETLLDLLPDEDLNPGLAHRALFALDNIEGIVTTNNLDTLLDRDKGTGLRWSPIIEDVDFARRTSESLEVIYLHGHRSQPKTWVFSRKDYEDVLTTRPLMMAKVRQLFAQHPVLFIGFSLTDPNFHAIIRSVEFITQRGSPPALALMVDQQPAPFVDYWQALGTKVVTFDMAARDLQESGNDWRSKAFVHFFGIFQGPTLQELDLAKEVRSETSFDGRLLLIKEILEDQDEFSSSDHWPPSSVVNAWNEVVLPREEDRRVNIVNKPRYVTPRQVPDAYLHLLSEQAQAEIAEQERMLALRELPSTRFDYDQLLSRAVDSAVVSQRATWSQLAQWFDIWLEKVIDVGFEPNPEIQKDIGIFCNLCSYVWMRCATGKEATPASSDVIRRALSALGRCYRVAQRYGVEASVNHIKIDLYSLGYNEQPEDLAVEHWATDMQTAQQAFFDGNFEKSLLWWQKARKKAATRERHFEEWLSVQGALQSLERLQTPTFSESLTPKSGVAQTEKQVPIQDYDVEASASAREDLRRAKARLDQYVLIRNWNTALEERRRRALSEYIQRFNEARQDASTLDTGLIIRFSSAPNDLWRAWRDLEQSHAPPLVLRDVAQDIVAVQALDLADELTLRVRFDIKTEHWLEDFSDQHDAIKEPDYTKRAADSATIARQVVSHAPATKTEWYARLKMCKSIRYLVGWEDVEQIAIFLTACKEIVGSETATYDKYILETTAHYRDAWLMFTSVAGQQQVSNHDVIHQIVDLAHQSTDHGYRWLSSGFPWARWVSILGIGDCLRMTEKLVSGLQGTPMAASAYKEAAVFAIQASLSTTTNDMSLHREKLTEYALSACSVDGDLNDTVRRHGWAALLALGEYSTALTLAEQQGRLNYSLENFDPSKLVECAGTAAELSRYAGTREEGIKGTRSVVRALLDYEAVAEAYTANNPTAGLFSSCAMAIVSADLSLEEHAGRMLTWTNLDHGVYCAIAMRPEPDIWGSQWDSISRALLGVSYRSEDIGRTKARLSLIAGLQKALQAHDERKNQYHRDTVITLLRNLMMSACDRRLLMAQSIVWLAHNASCTHFASELMLQDLLIRTLSEAAKDPRPKVRSIAATSVPQLSKRGGTKEMKLVSERLAADLEADINASVRTALEYGKSYAPPTTTTDGA